VKARAWRAAVAGLAVGFLFADRVGRAAGPAPEPDTLAVRAGIDVSEWNRLLHTYVDGRGFVDYEGWRKSVRDRAALESFLRDLAAPASPPASGNERRASLLNAYNAATIAWILENFPTESIRSLPGSFDSRRHAIGGRKVSLDDIESALRKSVGFRVHAAISCASRSCPPLASEAYRADGLNARLDAQMRRWLAREDLNRFDPAAGLVRLSKIFDWFEGDFLAAGGVGRVLTQYAPERFRGFLEAQTYRVEYLDYDWGLNDQGGRGKNYSRLHLLWDKIQHP
jgi:hypothetical protein